MRDSTKALITGTARGAMKGALLGIAAIGLFGVATAVMGVGPFAAAFAGASHFITYGLSAAAVFVNSVMGGMGAAYGFGTGAAMVAGGAIGAVYKGVTDFADTEEVTVQKEKMVEMAKVTNEIEHAKAKAIAPKVKEFVPAKLPKAVPLNEMPQSWVQQENARRIMKKQTQGQGAGGVGGP